MKLLFLGKLRRIFLSIVEVIMNSLLEMDVLSMGRPQTSLAKTGDRLYHVGDI